MFNLPDEIQRYCQSVYPVGAQRDEAIAELSDHLHCEVERWMGEGLSEEAAFQRAIDQVGAAEELAVEGLRAQTGWQRFASVLFALSTLNAKSLTRLLTPTQASAWIIGVSLFFAGMMTLTSRLGLWFDDSQTWTYLWLAVWWVPYSLLCVVAANGPKKECESSEA